MVHSIVILCCVVLPLNWAYTIPMSLRTRAVWLQCLHLWQITTLRNPGHQTYVSVVCWTCTVHQQPWFASEHYSFVLRTAFATICLDKCKFCTTDPDMPLFKAFVNSSPPRQSLAGNAKPQLNQANISQIRPLIIGVNLIKQHHRQTTSNLQNVSANIGTATTSTQTNSNPNKPCQTTCETVNIKQQLAYTHINNTVLMNP